MPKQESKNLPSPAFPAPQVPNQPYQLADQLENLHLGSVPGQQQWVGGFGVGSSAPPPQYNYSSPPPPEKPLPSAPGAGGPLTLPAMEMPTPSFVHPDYVPRPPAVPMENSTYRPPLHMLTPPRPHPQSNSDTAVTKVSDLEVPPENKRASSEPPPTSKTVQCGGTTKAGKQCTRQVKAPPLSSYLDPTATVDRYCYQHTKELLEPTGFYSHKKKDVWIEFKDWVPDYLQPATKAALRVEMGKPASASDEPGYIYCYEIRNPKTPNHVHLKVGRAVKLAKRLDEWSKQCGSKEVVLRGWYPGTVDGAESSTLKGQITAGEPGIHCHRMERLIHLELADLAMHAPYQKADYLKSTASSSEDDDAPATKKKSKSKSPKATSLKMTGQPCTDCGKTHKEIFTLEKATDKKMKDEWRGLVEPVILKWANFVQAFV